MRPNRISRPSRGLAAKLIMYHAGLTRTSAPRNSINYYQSVVETMGSEHKTQNFMRLFMAPGMQHCGGGPGPDTFDSLASLEQWVEKDKAPGKIIASHLTNGVVDRTRPSACTRRSHRYKGKGSTDDAKNFVCVSPSRWACVYRLLGKVGQLLAKPGRNLPLEHKRVHRRTCPT